MPDDPQPPTEAWHASSQVRTALAVVLVPAFIRIAQHSALGPWLAAHLGIDILTLKASDIVDWLMLAISAIGSVYWIHKRVKAGQNPNSDAPQIIPPKIVQRLTGDVKIVKPVPPPPPDDIRYHPYTGEAMTAADFDALVARMLKPDDPPKRG